jgi:hypothetical protein
MNVRSIEAGLNPQPAINGKRWQDKVSAEAQTCFECLRAILTFPLRYLGSKTWSIPGIVLRTPWLLFKKIFVDSSVSLKQELFGDKYHYFFEKKLTPAELKPYLPYACATGFVFWLNPKCLLPGWRHIPAESLDFGGAPRDGTPVAKNGYFFDPATELKVVLVEKGDELVISFSALNIREQSLIRAFFSGNPSVRTVIGSMSGFIPPIYEKADAFVQSIRNLPQFQNKRITLSGHCYGGAIASYVGIKSSIPAICLNTFPLGVGLQKYLGSDRLNRADEYVIHISSEHDFLTERPYQAPADIFFSRLGLRTPGHFGRRFLIPSAYSNSKESHLYPLSSMIQHLGYDHRADPQDLPKEELI